MLWYVNLILVLFIQSSILCDYELSRLDGVSTSEMRRDGFGKCDCVSARGERLINCTFSCDRFKNPQTGCFWTCENSILSLNRKHVRECYCRNISRDESLRPCRGYPGYWTGLRPKSHGCCRKKDSLDGVCLGAPRELERLSAAMPTLCVSPQPENDHRLEMLCRIATQVYDDNTFKINGISTEVLMRIAEYRMANRTTTSTTVTQVTADTRQTITPRTKNVKLSCAQCRKLYPGDLQLPFWVSAVAGVGGVILGFLMAICISRCFLRPMAERELKQAVIRSASEVANSDTSALHSRAPLITTSSNSSAEHRILPPTTDNLDFYNRRHVIGGSRNSSEFHQYESLTRFGMLPDDSPGKGATNDYLKPTPARRKRAACHYAPGIEGKAIARATSHEYFALEDVVAAKKASVSDSPLQPHDYLTVLDDSEEDGAPECRNTRPRSKEYYVLESGKSDVAAKIKRNVNP